MRSLLKIQDSRPKPALYSHSIVAGGLLVMS